MCQYVLKSMFLNHRFKNIDFKTMVLLFLFFRVPFFLQEETLKKDKIHREKETPKWALSGLKPPVERDMQKAKAREKQRVFYADINHRSLWFPSLKEESHLKQVEVSRKTHKKFFLVKKDTTQYGWKFQEAGRKKRKIQENHG